MVRVISLAGGTRGIADLLVTRAAGVRSARLATALLGLAVFFDDYANTLVVGTTMRPIADRFRISREKAGLSRRFHRCPRSWHCRRQHLDRL